MRVTVLGSGSQGNAIALATEGHVLLLDAGFGFRTLTRRLQAAAISPDALCGVVLTHEHGDHARGAHHLARRLAIPVFGSGGTLRALATRLRGIAVAELQPRGANTIGPFAVRICRTNHDAAEPVAVAVRCAGSAAKIGVAYDLGRPTPGVRTLLKRSTCLIVEANHDEAMLGTGPYPAAVKRRIAGPGGHLSNRAAATFLAELCHEGLETVVLAHLSHACNEAGLARRVVSNALVKRGFVGRILVARQDRPLDAVSSSFPAEQLALNLVG